MEFIQSPSPNFNERLAPLDMIVLHYTGMETGAAALERMCDPEAEVSAHYMVETDGRVFRLVAEDMRAWHAGRSSWQGDGDLNSRSIGIEIVNGGHNVPLPDGSLPPYPAAQINAVITLCLEIINRHGLRQSRIVGHSDIAPERKEDPGEHFPWAKLAESGVGLWPEQIDPSQQAGPGLEAGVEGPMVNRMQRYLALIGYDVTPDGFYDARTEATVRAFQRRWNPSSVTGEADLATLTLIERVAELTSL